MFKNLKQRRWIYLNLLKLKEIRELRNITQEKMSIMLGYKDKSSYCLIESGKTRISISQAATIKKHLCLSSEEFEEIFLQ